MSCEVTVIWYFFTFFGDAVTSTTFKYINLIIIIGSEVSIAIIVVDITLTKEMNNGKKWYCITFTRDAL